MRKDYEGKLGIGQLFFCIFAAATLFIPFALQPEMIFAMDKLMPIGASEINAWQNDYIQTFFETLSFPVPDISSFLPYVVYAFYGIVGALLFFTLIMMVLRSEIIRQILRAFSILVGIVMLGIFLINLLTVAGFFTYYISGKFGSGALIVDCILNYGLLFFLGLTVMSIIGAVKHFSSFFGKSY